MQTLVENLPVTSSMPIATSSSICSATPLASATISPMTSTWTSAADQAFELVDEVLDLLVVDLIVNRLNWSAWLI